MPEDSHTSTPFHQDQRLHIFPATTFCRHIDNNPFGQVISDIGPHLVGRIPAWHNVENWISGLMFMHGEPLPQYGEHLAGSPADHLLDLEVFCLLLGRNGGDEIEPVMSSFGFHMKFWGDCVLIVRRHPQGHAGEYVRVGIVESGHMKLEEETYLFSPWDMEELFRDAEVQEFLLV
ncbi:hypothetical protein QBC35DRAFT_215081 [Podospora australis]|uniref:Uncharacterized protein n=1 Tax=Podospora australis TaxID=1536484 RepID=A0AAN7AB27_9PEZI|nr:hypothetical protein QBC35DRAFT_215081 [Podospora australis]